MFAWIILNSDRCKEYLPFSNIAERKMISNWTIKMEPSIDPEKKHQAKSTWINKSWSQTLGDNPCMPSLTLSGSKIFFPLFVIIRYKCSSQLSWLFIFRFHVNDSTLIKRLQKFYGRWEKNFRTVEFVLMQRLARVGQVLGGTFFLSVFHWKEILTFPCFWT